MIILNIIQVKYQALSRIMYIKKNHWLYILNTRETIKKKKFLEINSVLHERGKFERCFLYFSLCALFLLTISWALKPLPV